MNFKGIIIWKGNIFGNCPSAESFAWWYS